MRQLKLSEEAVAVASQKHRAKALLSLSLSLITRVRKCKSQDDLRMAMQAIEDALRLIPESHSDMPLCLSTLGSIMKLKFEDTGSVEEISNAIVAFEKSVTLSRRLESFGPQPQLLLALGLGLENAIPNFW